MVNTNYWDIVNHPNRHIISVTVDKNERIIQFGTDGDELLLSHDYAGTRYGPPQACTPRPALPQEVWLTVSRHSRRVHRMARNSVGHTGLESRTISMSSTLAWIHSISRPLIISASIASSRCCRIRSVHSTPEVRGPRSQSTTNVS